MPAVPVLGESSLLHQWDDNTRRGRYGVAYLHAICAQAGAQWTPTPPDEDRLAIDGAISLGPGSVNVQIKCTSGATLTGRQTTIPLEPTWVASWAEQVLAPTYVVVVKVPKSIPTWVAHDDARTLHRTGAFWARFDPARNAKSIVVPRSQRFTIETLHEWRRDLNDRYEQLKAGVA